MINPIQLQSWAIESQDITAPAERLAEIYLIVKHYCTVSNQLDDNRITAINIIRNIAQNPNISIAILTAIYENFQFDFRELVINNSAFSLLLLENPNLLAELEEARLYQEEIEESMVGRWQAEDDMMRAMDALDALDKM